MDRAVSLRKFETEIRSLETAVAAYAATRDWRIVSTAYPTLSVAFLHSRSSREIEFRFACDDWDELPPSLTLHDPTDGRELSWAEWPKEVWSVLASHTSTQKPFLCLPGIREYHSHTSHLGDKWEGYRLQTTYRLLYIVDRVHRRFEDSNG